MPSKRSETALGIFFMTKTTEKIAQCLIGVTTYAPKFRTKLVKLALSLFFSFHMNQCFIVSALGNSNSSFLSSRAPLDSSTTTFPCPWHGDRIYVLETHFWHDKLKVECFLGKFSQRLIHSSRVSRELQSLLKIQSVFLLRRQEVVICTLIWRNYCYLNSNSKDFIDTNSSPLIIVFIQNS